MNHANKKGEPRQKRIVGYAGKPGRLIAFLMVFFLTVSGIPEMFAESSGIFAGIAGTKQVFAAEDAGTERAEIDEIKLPTGGVLPYEIREVSGEDVPEDIPVYGGSGTYSVRKAQARSAESLQAEHRYGYNYLSAAQQTLYDNCLQGIETFLAGDYKTKDFTGTKGENATVFQVSCSSLGKEEIFATYFCLRNDYPEYYWLPNGVSYSQSGNTKTLLVGIGQEFFQASVRKATDEAIAAGPAEYVAAAGGAKNDYEKLRIVHDKLLNRVEYAYVTGSSSRPEDALWAHSLAGAFDEHCAVVCEGYSKALQYILNHIGIENVYMTGKGNGADHAWNGVKLGEEWFYVDATWDDVASDSKFKDVGQYYHYFCIPASVFNKEHTVDKPTSSNWLYQIPTMSESDTYTFYKQYNCDFTSNIASVEDAENALKNAGGSVPGMYIHALVSENTKNHLLGALGGSRSGVKTPDGNIVFFVDAAQYKVKNPAIKIKLDETEITINRDEAKTATLTATLTAANGECDDVVRWSSSSSCITITPGADGKSATVTAKRNGTATITATAAGGKAEPATCTVTVTGTAEHENIYLDASKTPAEEKDFMIWVNGGNVKLASGTKYNYKVRSLYTDIKASQITTRDAKGREKKKNGKLVAGITLSDEEPTLVRGKIVDAEAAKIAKATINAKTGLVKITAQKQVGEVYLWVIDTGDEHNTAYAKITVTAAPAKILLNDANYETADREIVKKQTLALGDYMDVYLEPLLASKGTDVAQGGSYSFTYSKNGENYVSVTEIPDSKYGFRITAAALDKAKAGKTLNVKVNFVCNENNKKASVSITITNPMDTLTYAAGNGLTEAEGEDDAFTVKYSETQAQELTLNFTAQATNPDYATTDKPKIYALSAPNSLTINEKGKPVVTKPSGTAAKLKAAFSRDKRSIVIKVPKKLEAGTKTYFALYYNEDCYEVWSVEVVGTAE